MRLPVEAAELARRHHGILTTDQLLGVGLSPAAIWRLCERGVLIPVHRGVFRVAGSPATWRQEVMAAVSLGAPRAFAAIRTAAPLLGLHRTTGGVIEIVSEQHRRARNTRVRTHETLDLPAIDQVVIDGIPTVGVDRTLIDVGRYWPASRVGELLDVAVRDGLTTYQRFEARVGTLARRGRPGIAVARTVLAARGLDDGWGFEAAMRKAMRAASLPDPVREWTVVVDDRRYRIDIAYPGALLGIECDSTAWHTLPHQVERDLARRNAITSLGIHLIHVTPTMLRTDSGHVMDQIRRQLELRSNIRH